MNKTVFEIPKMDCPSEERIIRLALEGKAIIKKLDFDLQGRKLKIHHEGSPQEALSILVPLGFGAKISSTEELSEIEELIVSSPTENDFQEIKVLRRVFAINALMFIVEIVTGWLAQSAGLIADSLDMFADAAVFALSLYAVGKALSLKKRAARLSGYFQMILAIGAFVEVVRRFIVGSEPVAPIMIGIAAIALVANALCMIMLAKHRTGEVHMRASWIFLSNDVIANGGVIVAGILVSATSSHIPDLIVGGAIGIIVLIGALRILKAAK